MPFCSRCGKELLVDAKFCMECGASVAVPIPPPLRMRAKRESKIRRNILIGIALIFLVLVAIIAIGSLIPDPARQLYEEGQRLQQTEQYDLAIEKYQRILDEYPDSRYASKANGSIPECYYRWGEKLKEEERYDAAIEKYQTVIERFPDTKYADEAERSIPECYYRWASQLSTMKRYDEAVEKYIIIIERYADSAWASSDKFISKVGKNAEDACRLAEAGFDYVCTTPENLLVFKKRK